MVEAIRSTIRRICATVRGAPGSATPGGNADERAGVQPTLRQRGEGAFMVTLDQAGWRRSAVVLVPTPAAIRDLGDFLWIDERPRLPPLVPHQWRVLAVDAPHHIYSRTQDRVSRTAPPRLHDVRSLRQSHYLDF